MPDILNLLAPLLLGSLNRGNLPTRVRKSNFVASKRKKKQKTVPKCWCSKLGLLLRQP
jgi:hypothetical protein